MRTTAPRSRSNYSPHRVSLIPQVPRLCPAHSAQTGLGSRASLKPEPEVLVVFLSIIEPQEELRSNFLLKMAEVVVAGGSGLQSGQQLWWQCGGTGTPGKPTSLMARLAWEGMDCLPGCPRTPFRHLLPPVKEQHGGSHTPGPWGSLLPDPVTQNESNSPRGKEGKGRQAAGFSPSSATLPWGAGRST